MLESEELIQTTLDLSGEDIDFCGVTIKGIPGSLVYNVQSFDSVYDIVKQDFDFQVSKRDFIVNAFNAGSLFNYSLGSKIYSFKVVKTIDDLTGWLHLFVNLEGMTAMPVSLAS